MPCSISRPNSSKFEEKFEEVNGVQVPTNIPSSSGVNENPATTTTVENRAEDIEAQGQYDDGICVDPNAAQDSVSGMMKIVPSDVDVSLSLIHMDMLDYRTIFNMIIFQMLLG